jgi:hypothetical protein
VQLGLAARKSSGGVVEDDCGMAEKWGRIIAEAFEPVREDMRFMR